MKKNHLLFFFIVGLFCSLQAYSQSWLPMGPDNFNQPSFSAVNSTTSMAVNSSGVPYIVFSDISSYYKATVRKYNGSNWETVGIAGFSAGSASDPKIAIASDGTPYVVFQESDLNNKLTVMKFDGSNWVLVGDRGFTGGQDYENSIAIKSDGTPYVAFHDNNSDGIVMKYSGAAWVQVGSILDGNANETDLKFDAGDIPYVVYNNGSMLTSVKKFIDTDWVLVGAAGFSGGWAFGPSLAFNSDNMPYVAYADYMTDFSGNATVKKYNGSAWVAEGSTKFSAGKVVEISLAFDGATPYVVFRDVFTSNKTTVMTYNGSSWSVFGTAGFSEGTVQGTCMAISSTGVKYVSYADAGRSDKAVVMKYDGSNWVNCGPTGFSSGKANYLNTAVDPNGISYVVFQDVTNSNKATVMKYNGSTWALVGNAGFSAGTATYTSMAIDASGTPYVVYKDGGNSDKATVMKYSGGSWTNVGTAGFSPGTVNYTDIAIDGSGTPFVVYQDGANSNKASVKKYDGSSWVEHGSSTGISAGQADFTNIVIKSDGKPYIICKDNGNGGKPYMYYLAFHPTYWFSSEAYSYVADNISMAIDPSDNIYIAFKDANASYGRATVRKYNGGSWSTVGTAGFSTGEAPTNITMATDGIGTPYMSYNILANIANTFPYKMFVQKYNGSSWSSTAISAGPAEYASMAINGGMATAVFNDFGAWGFKSAYSTLTQQATNVTFTDVQSAQLTFDWTNGGGNKRIVFVKQGTSGSTVPVNNATYTANTTFGSGTQLGTTGWYCVYNGTGTSVTVTGLTPGTTYRAFVCEYNDDTDAGIEYLTTLASNNPKNQQTFTEITWTGTTSADWSIATNWDPAFVPISTYNVTIPVVTTNYPVVSNAPGSPAVCNNLTINSGASVTIAAGKALTVNGTLTNNTGNNGIIIQSTTDGTGSLIHYSTGVNGTINRYVTGSGTLTLKMYHLVSVPLIPESASFSSLFLGAYLYDFDVAANYWIAMGTPTTNILDETRGYMIYTPELFHTYVFEGAMNSGSFSPTVIHSGQGYNLVPNPYPSAIDWSASSGWTKTNINNEIHIWPSGGSNYASYVGGVGTNGGTRYIPEGQSFFVKTNASSPVLNMNNSTRVHNAQAFWKSGENLENVLRIKAVANNYSDETIIRLTENSTSGFDADYDAAKMYGLEDAPQLFSVFDEMNYSINSLPLLQGEKIVPVHFETQYQGAVNLTFEGADSFDPSVEISLKDELTGQVINLRKQSSYVFDHNPENQAYRFNLKFGGTIGFEDIEAQNSNLWIAGNELFIHAPELSGEKALIEILNTSGQLVQTQNIILSEMSSIRINYSGLIIIKMSTKDKMMVTKGVLLN